MTTTKLRKPTPKNRLTKIIKEISAIRKSLPQVRKVIVVKKVLASPQALQREYQKGYDKGFDQGARSVRVSYGKKEHLHDLQHAAYLRGYSECQKKMIKSAEDVGPEGEV